MFQNQIGAQNTISFIKRLLFRHLPWIKHKKKWFIVEIAVKKWLKLLLFLKELIYKERMLLFCCCFQNLFLFFQKRFLLLCVSMNVKSLQNFHTFLNMNSQQTLKNQFIRLWDDYITLMHTWIFYSRSCGEQKCLF